MKKPDERFFGIARKNDQAALLAFAKENSMEIVNDLPGDTRIAGHGLVIDAGKRPVMWLAPKGRAWSRVMLDGSGIDVQNEESGKWEIIPFSDWNVVPIRELAVQRP